MSVVGRLLVLAIGMSAASARAQPASRADAAAAPASFVHLQLSGCAREVVDEDALQTALRIELGAASATSAPAPPAEVSVDCAGPGARLSLQTRGPAGESRLHWSLDDVSPAMRPRTLALVITEQLRAAEPWSATTPPARPRPELTATWLAPTSLPATTTTNPRLARNLTIAFGAAAGASLILGGSLVAAGGSGRDSSAGGQSNLITSGIAVMSVGGGLFAAGVVTLGFWLHDRGHERRTARTTAATSAPPTAASAASLSAR